MISLLGMPITFRGRVIGDLYLTDKENGEMWTDQDEWLTSLLASHAGVAMANAHFYQVLEHERVKAETERQRLKALLDSLPEGVVVVDATGRVTDMNEMAHRLMGWELGRDVTQRSVHERDLRRRHVARLRQRDQSIQPASSFFDRVVPGMQVRQRSLGTRIALAQDDGRFEGLVGGGGFALLFERPAQKQVGQPEVLIHLDGGSALFDRLVVFAGEVKDQAQRSGHAER